MHHIPFAVHVVNILFALIGVIAIFLSINRMNGGTSWYMKAVYVTLGAALMGQVLILAEPEKWQVAVGTLALGGVAALLVGSWRRVVGIDQDRVRRMVWVLLGATWIWFLIGIER